jgi:hypothetical protein
MSTLEDISKPPLAIVCHDAGGANLIANWILEYKYEVKVCMEGPAKYIWHSHFPDSEMLSMNDALKGANTLISGTGMGNLEYLARTEARKLKIKSIAVIDHWINYKERFLRQSVLVLPDQIIVSDDYAKSQAEDIFKPLSIIQMPNLYLQNITKFLKKPERRELKNPYENILIVAEPLAPKIIENNNFLFQDDIDYFFLNIEKVNTSKDIINICLRPHPSESIGNYDFIRDQNQDLVTNFKISHNRTIQEDIEWADLVCGTDSFAMVIALTAKVPTLSFTSPNRADCLLPYKEIIHLKNI